MTIDLYILVYMKTMNDNNNQCSKSKMDEIIKIYRHLVIIIYTLVCIQMKIADAQNGRNKYVAWETDKKIYDDEQ